MRADLPGLPDRYEAGLEGLMDQRRGQVYQRWAPVSIGVDRVMPKPAFTDRCIKEVKFHNPSSAPAKKD